MRAAGVPFALAASTLACCVLAACVPAAGDKVNAQVKFVQAEETPQKLLARGRAFATVGDHARAEQYFAAALDRGADPAVALPLLMRACAEEKRFRAAIDYAEPHLKKHPGDFRLRFVVASFYATIGESTAAREELERIAKDKPDFAAAHFALAVLLRDEHGDVVSADGHFREYLRLEPRGAHAEEARASLLKMVDHGGVPITVPPVWRDVGALPPEPVRKSP
jgi:tetratricopeptide (TPR) repeat protein